MPFVAAAKHKVTNPKDYLYGLLGVLKEEIRLQIPVDYNFSVHEVYRQAAIAVFKYDPDKFLGNAILLLRFHPRLPDLPSWAPYLEAQFQDYNNPRFEDYAFGLVESNALPFKRPRVTLDAEGTKLSLAGLKIDRIAEVHKLPVPDDDSIYSLKTHLTIFAMARDLALSARNINIPQDSSLYQVAELRHIVDLFWVLLKPEGFGQLAETERLSAWQLLAGEATEVELEQQFGALEWDRLREKVIKGLIHTLDKRAVVVSEHGFFGPSVPQVEAGDCIALLYGMSCPMILRPVPELRGYEMVGFARISGLMDSTILEKYDAKGCFSGLETVFDIY
jgi:hypothetical protein